MGTYERKTRDIQRSLHRRARIRRAYFKMIGEDPKANKKSSEREALDTGKEIDLSDASASDDEMNSSSKVEPEAPKKLTGRQLARRKRAEKYHAEKEKEEKLKQARLRRETHKSTMTKKTSRGQPKLGSQVSVLLDKIKSQEK